MKKSYNSLWGYLFVILVLIIITGCSSSNNETSSESNGTSNESSDDVITIEYRHVNSKDWGGDAVKQIVENFNNSQDKIYVEEKYTPDNYPGVMQKVQAGISGGNPPDVAQVGYNFLSFVNDGIPFTPIEELSGSDDNDPNFIEDNFLPNIVDLGRDSEGQLIGLPYGLSNPVLYYNADMLQEVGWDPDSPPKTWDEVEELSTKIKEETDKYGIYIQEPPDSWAQYGMARSNGGEWFSVVDGTPTALIDSPGTVEVYEMMGDFVEKGIGLHTNWESGVQEFQNGNVAMAYTTIGKAASIA